MHPAPSVIIFTVLSGLGFGILAVLALGLTPVSGTSAFLAWGAGYALAVIGLIASTLHLGNPQRALLAFTQWRSSWLSREAWASVLTLLTLAPLALSDIFGWTLPRPLGWLAATLCALTVLATGMIYAQIRAVPRWHHWITPALFLAFWATGGALATGQTIAPFLSLGLFAMLQWNFQDGDKRFARAGQTLAAATGLQALGTPRMFEPAHTSENYLMREMIHIVARRHALKLRLIAMAAILLPAGILLLPLGWFGTAVALISHVIGAFTARWLFFAEAEHTVGLYYGR